MAAAELGLLSLTQLQNLSQSYPHQPPPPISSSTAAEVAASTWMWNSKQSPAVAAQDEDDSWEVRAFAEDTGNAMGTTWPPRSYTCTFCRREFRSAQALGGHMNVHRRDRARLHQTPLSTNSSPRSPSSTLLIPSQEFVANGGLCLVYSLPNPNALFTRHDATASDTPSTLLSISPSSADNLVYPPQPHNFPITAKILNNSSLRQYSTNDDPPASLAYNSDNDQENSRKKKDSAMEELDLELRLGPR